MGLILADQLMLIVQIRTDETGTGTGPGGISTKIHCFPLHRITTS